MCNQFYIGKAYSSCSVYLYKSKNNTERANTKIQKKKTKIQTTITTIINYSKRTIKILKKVIQKR